MVDGWVDGWMDGCGCNGRPANQAEDKQQGLTPYIVMSGAWMVHETIH
jgi:hypothetical protein